MASLEPSEMIMDGLDTLSQVALLADTSVCFDSYHGVDTGFPRPLSESMEELNTPVTSSSDMTFFVDTLDSLPIATNSGRFTYFVVSNMESPNQLIEHCSDNTALFAIVSDCFN